MRLNKQFILRQKKSQPQGQMFSFEKVSFFDNIVPLYSPSESNQTQNLRRSSQGSYSQESSIPLWKKVTKQKHHLDSQSGQNYLKQKNQGQYSRQSQQKMIDLPCLQKSQAPTENYQKPMKNPEFQEKEEIEQQGQMKQIQVLEQIDFKDMNQGNEFFKPRKFKDEKQRGGQIQDYDRKCAQLYYGQVDHAKIKGQSLKQYHEQQPKNNKRLISGQRMIKLKLDFKEQIQIPAEYEKYQSQQQKYQLPIESEQLKSHIQKTHQEVQQILKFKQRMDKEMESQQKIKEDKINPDESIQKDPIQQNGQIHKNEPKMSTQSKPTGMRNSLSLYERIMQHNSNKPNMRIFVQMENKFEPIRKTQTQKFNHQQFKQEVQKMSQSLPVDERAKHNKNLQIISSVNTLIEPVFPLQKQRLQKQFNHKIKQLQSYYQSRIQEQNDNFKELFNQMKTQIQNLQSEKNKLSDELYELHREIHDFKSIELPKKEELHFLQSDNQKLKNQLYELKQTLVKHQNQSLTFHLKYEPLLQQIANSKLEQPIDKPRLSQIYDQMTFLYQKLQIKELQCQKLQLQKNQLYIELRREKQKIKELQITAQNQWNQNKLKYQALQKQLKILKFSYNQLLKRNQRPQISPQIYFYPQMCKRQQKIQQQIKQSLTKRYLNINNPENLQKKITKHSRKSYLNPEQQRGLTKAFRKKNEEALLLSPKVERIKNRFCTQIQHYRTPSLERLEKHLDSQSKQKSRRIINQIKANIKLPNKEIKEVVDSKLRTYKKSEQLRHQSPKLRNNFNPNYSKDTALENINYKLQKLRAEVRKELQTQ